MAFLTLACACQLSGCTIGGGNSEESGFTATAQGGLLVAETGAEPAPGYSDGSVPWEATDEHIVNVSVQPEAAISLGDNRVVMGVGGVPYSEPQAGPGHSAGLECDALDAYATGNAGPSEVQGLTFDPNGSSAWACFELKRDANLPDSLAIAWYSLPLDFGSYYVGIADRGIGSWRWFSGPDDGVLSFDASGMQLGDNALVAIVLEGNQRADLWKLRWGASEIRGTGLMPEDHSRSASSWTPLRSASSNGSLPSKVDLNHYAPWVHNQGSFGSCTAFACNDTAFGILLARTYGNDGWDSTTAQNSTSPLWSYVNSGKPPIASSTFNPLCAGSSGRYMSDAFEVLEIMGTATEAAAPYTTATDCSQAFSQTAHDEAEIVRIDSWSWINSNGQQLVNDIKSVLATDTPVPMATYGLENSLLYYNGGIYEFGGTAGINGGHAMCIVGYDDSLQAFDIRNQWGSSWGDNGHVWFSYDSVAQMSQLGRFYAYYMDLSYSQALADHFLGGGSDQSEDQGEPNNDMQHATLLGSFPVSELQHTLGDNGDELDWLKFSYTAGATTSFSFTSNPSQLILGVELYDANGNLLADSYDAAGTQNISGSWSNSGTAYIKLQPTYGTGAYMINAVSTSAPTVPEGLTAVANDAVGYGVNLSWQASTGADAYIVQRSRNAGGPFTEIGSSYTTEYFDFSARDWGSYHYRLLASGPGGVSAPCPVVSCSVQSPLVADLSASQGSRNDRVVLSWSPVAEADAYQIFRAMAGNNLYLPLRRVSSASFEDMSVSGGSRYAYKVAAVQGDLVGRRGEAVQGWSSGSQLIVQGELRPDGNDDTVTTDELQPLPDGGSPVRDDSPRLPID